MSLLTSTMTWFNAAAAGNLAVAVTYQRGVTKVAWSAVPAETEYVSSDDPEMVETLTSRDYLGDPAVLVAGGIVMPPLAGDKVIETIAGKTVTHEVMFVSGGQTFKFVDPGEQRLCVHSKEIARV